MNLLNDNVALIKTKNDQTSFTTDNENNSFTIAFVGEECKKVKKGDVVFAQINSPKMYIYQSQELFIISESLILAIL